MAPKSAPVTPVTPQGADAGVVALTARETEILGFAFHCLESDPKIDNLKLATLAGFTNPRSATNAWLNIKKKLGVPSSAAAKQGGTTTPTNAKDDDEASTATPTPASTGEKRKAADTPKNPAKKGRGRPPKAKKVKAEASDEEEVTETGAADETMPDVKEEFDDPVTQADEDGDSATV